MKRKVSIVVPVYNVANYIHKCVDSLIHQTYKNIEIIIVNDGSCDDSIRNISLFLADKRVILFNKDNGGLSEARNYGKTQTSGDYILFIDADDYVDSDFVEELIKNMEESEADISICNFYYEYNDEKHARDKSNFDVKIFDSISGIKEIYKFNSFGVGVWNKLFKRELLENIEFPVGRISEDFFVMYKIFARANRIIYSNKPMYHYIQRNSSITKSREICFDVLDAAMEFYDYCNTNNKQLIPIARTNIIFSGIAIYNTGILYKTISSDAKNRLVKIVKQYNKGGKEQLTLARKIQLMLFLRARPFYNVIFLHFKINRMKKEGR